ncbi:MULTISPECIES: DUF1641 domain-containing protein [Bacillus]|uniref:DUF1641 domain-containing protein n=1 Tax=Bacillus TaxID=1386 RepID=UPI000301EA5E|nr:MULTISPECIES: DUF1641 domain-containing protein [Bacillus]
MTEIITQANSEQEVKVSANQGKNDVLDQLLQPEVQESLTTLVEQLPKLTEMVNTLTKSYEFMQLVMTDDVLKKDTFGAITDIIDPVKDSVKHIAANAIEAKDRAAESNEVIGLFGLLKLIKDPQAQKLFRFINAYLEVSEERSSQK